MNRCFQNTFKNMNFAMPVRWCIIYTSPEFKGVLEMEKFKIKEKIKFLQNKLFLDP